MQKFVKILALSVLAFAGPAVAVPMLSADNSVLSGVEVDGVLYDVTFGDDVIRDVYSWDLVQEPGWADFSISMITAIVLALNSLTDPVAGPDIPGCGANDGLSGYFGPDYCFLYLPTYFDEGNRRYGVGNVATLTPDGAIEYSAQIYGSMDGYGDTMDRGTLPDEYLTLVHLNHIPSVPLPSSLLLVGIGVLATWVRRGNAAP